MTDKQIIDAGIDYTMSTCPICMGGGAFEDMIRRYNRNPSFEAGATWAKEKLIKEVCERLNNNLFEVVAGIDETSVMSIENIGLIEFVENVKKAMDK
jgi:hypothetical protein